jgi:hypothetical protein
MQVHIERKHNGLTVPIQNYKPTGYHSDLVNQKALHENTMQGI